MTAPQWVIADRQQGKSTALVTWLLGGHRVWGWPGWSRVLVVAHGQRAAEYIERMPQLQHELWGKRTGGLGKLVITVEEMRGLRGLDPTVEFALDDVEALLARLLPMPVAVLSATGTAVTPGALIEQAGRDRRLAEEFEARRPRLITRDET